MTKQFVPTLPNSSPQYLNSVGAFNSALIDPSKFTFFYDDFTGCVKQTTNAGLFATGGQGIMWQPFLSASGCLCSGVTPDDAGCIGSCILTTGAVSGNVTQMISCVIIGTFTAAMCPMNDKTFDIKLKAAISATTNVVTYPLLLSDNVNNSYGIEFDTTIPDSTWTIVENVGGVITRTTITGAVLDTNYHTFRMRSVTPGTVLYSVDGGTEISRSFTANTTMWISPYVSTKTSSARSLKIDYIWGWISANR
jgi:hypothetical protein